MFFQFSFTNQCRTDRVVLFTRVMASPLVWQSLQNFSTCFHYYWKCPLGWDKTYRKFISITATAELIPWIVVVLIVSPIMCILCLIPILLTLYGIISPPLMNLLVCIIFMILMMLGVVIDLILYHAAEPTILGCNCLIQIANRDATKCELNDLIC